MCILAHFVSLKIGMLVQQFGSNMEVIPQEGCSKYFMLFYANTTMTLETRIPPQEWDSPLSSSVCKYISLFM